MPKTRRQKAIIKRNIFLSLCAVILVSVILVISFTVKSIFTKEKNPSSASSVNSGSSSQSTQVSSEPIKETTATIMNTGDIMVHSTQLDGALVKSTGEYDFSAFFKEESSYFKSADLAIANLEVTFGSTQSGKYSGYPAFNTPDSLADVIKDSGLNLLLTSNNHSYDTGLFGLKRTVQVLKQKGLEFTGTKEAETDPTYLVKDVNGIKIGIVDYTYETEGQTAGRKFLNGGIIAQEANNLINSFSYQRINDFYTESQSVISKMKNDGADYIVFYMHWGEEYQLTANKWQKDIAQNLSNFGVNMIIGSHPHVVQPMQLIQSSDGKTKTVCLYSMGNCVSNQRQELMSPECTTGHTEDGVLFSYTLKRSSDGSVSLVKLNLIPTWVNKYKGGSGYQYTVYPLETPDAGTTKYNLDSTAATKSAKSYERTKAIVSAGLTECQQAIGCEITFK